MIVFSLFNNNFVDVGMTFIYEKMLYCAPEIFVGYCTIPREILKILETRIYCVAFCNLLHFLWLDIWRKYFLFVY